MTDYNDGKWHVWAGCGGDKCPVNPDSRIDLQYWQGPGYTNDRAGLHDWQGPLMFRVTKPASVVETVTLNGGLYQDCGHIFEKAEYNKSWYTHRITFDTIDGKPDPASIRMEKLT